MKVLMVDVDGVLVHGRPDDGLHFTTYLERDLGLSSTLLQREFFQRHWAEIVAGRQPIEPCLSEVLAKIAPRLSIQTLLDYWFENDARLDHQLLADLASLRKQGTRLCLATNQEHRRATYLRDVLGLGQSFEAIFYSADLGVAKPAPEFFRLATERVGTEPDEIAFIDDSEANVTAARSFGWNAIHWTAFSSLADALARLNQAATRL